jgi:hypothetical protein
MVLISLAGIARSGFAASAALEWNANTEPDIASYRLFQSTSSLLTTSPEAAESQYCDCSDQYR